MQPESRRSPLQKHARPYSCGPVTGRPCTISSCFSFADFLKANCRPRVVRRLRRPKLRGKRELELRHEPRAFFPIGAICAFASSGNFDREPCGSILAASPPMRPDPLPVRNNQRNQMAPDWKNFSERKDCDDKFEVETIRYSKAEFGIGFVAGHWCFHRRCTTSEQPL